MPMSWKMISYFALTLPNRPGELAHFAAQLRDAGINLIGLWGYEADGDRTRIACVPESAAAFRRFFSDSGVPLDEGVTLYISDLDTSGALVELLHRIAAGGINIDSIECVAAGPRFGCFIWTDPAKSAALDAALQSD